MMIKKFLSIILTLSLSIGCTVFCSALADCQVFEDKNTLIEDGKIISIEKYLSRSALLAMCGQDSVAQTEMKAKRARTILKLIGVASGTLLTVTESIVGCIKLIDKWKSRKSEKISVRDISFNACQKLIKLSDENDGSGVIAKSFYVEGTNNFNILDDGSSFAAQCPKKP